MSKNIIICSDGTGNTAVKGRGSNVFKLFESLEFRANQDDPTAPRQIAIYDDGVGTEDFKPLKILGGALGVGLSRNIRQLYAELSRSYEPGDRIYMFGFSRGAFTVRSLAGLVARVGIIDIDLVKDDAELQELVVKAYEARRKCFRRFRKWRKSSPADDKPGEVFRELHSLKCETPIEFLGVWDTVDAYGFPVDEVADFWDQVVYPFRFPDTMLSQTVRCGRHALSIDDERRTFHPKLWTETEETETSGRIKQVWFTGVHSNVGGGYPKQGVSIVPLIWMMEEAEARGLRFVRSARQMYVELQNIHDKVYDSRAGLAGYYGYKPRSIPEICAKYSARVRIHVSVVERIAVGTEGYAPGNLTKEVEIVSDDGPTRVAALAGIMKDAFQQRGILLQKSRPWITTWRASQTLFIAATVAMVALYFNEYGADGFSGLMTFGGYVRIAKFLVEQWMVTAVLIATYALCYLADSRLKKAHSRFWFEARKKLRLALIDPAKKNATAV